jgi:hypothetical protein
VTAVTVAGIWLRALSFMSNTPAGSVVLSANATRPDSADSTSHIALAVGETCVAQAAFA